jgi:allantoinase
MTDTIYISSRIYLAPADRKSGGEFFDGGILVAGDDGKIRRIFESREEVNSWMYKYEAAFVVDYGDKIIMPGLIDVHVNANEPGRKDWEGFETLTKAAAHGGITTIAEMGVYNLPPVTTLFSLKNKINTSRNKVWVDTCFWGGIVPGNENDLLPLLDYGVVGFKCYLSGSGVAEFPPVSEAQLEKAMSVLDGRGTVVMCHAELEKYECEADEDGRSTLE